jgi:hypothetical protein
MATSSFHGLVIYFAMLGNMILGGDAAGSVMRRVDELSDHEATISPHGHFSSLAMKEQPKLDEEAARTNAASQPQINEQASADVVMQQQINEQAKAQAASNAGAHATTTTTTVTTTTVTTTTVTEYDSTNLVGFRFHLLNCASGDCLQVEGEEVFHMASCRTGDNGKPVREQLFIARGHASLSQRLTGHPNNVTLALNGKLMCNTGAYEMQVDDEECHQEYAEVSLVMKHGHHNVFRVQWNETGVGVDGVKKILQNQCLTPAASAGSQHVDLSTDCDQDAALWTTDDNSDACP